MNCFTLCFLEFIATFTVWGIHSDFKQQERLDRYKKFKEYQSRILVSTNLFGRGVDIERVNIVINFDMPTSSVNKYHFWTLQ